MKTTFTVLFGVGLMLMPASGHARGHEAVPLPMPGINLAPSGVEMPLEIYNPLKAASDAAEKTAGTGSRIVSEYKGGGTAVGGYRNRDSIYYTYSGLRGGDLKGAINFDVARAFRWDTVAYGWKPSFLYTMSYDAQNRPTSEIVQFWNAGTSTFINAYRYTFSYNTQGRPTVLKTESWNGGTSTWVNSLQYMGFTYNAAGQNTGYTSQTWKVSTSAWVNSQRFSGTFASHGGMLTWLTEIWNATTSAWGNMYNEAYTYNTANKPNRYTYRTWDAANTTWKNGEAYFYYYNSLNQPIAFSRQIGSTTGSGWAYTDSVGYTLNSMGSPVTEMDYLYSGANWQQVKKYTYTYTSANLESGAVLEVWNGTDFDNNARNYSSYNSFGQLVKNYEESFKSGAWTVAGGEAMSRYVYQNYSTGVNGVANSLSTLKVFPNPAKQAVMVDVVWKVHQEFAVSLYDITGRMLKQWNVASTGAYTERIDVARCPSGLYMLSVSAKGHQWVQTFAIQQ